MADWKKDLKDFFEEKEMEKKLEDEEEAIKKKQEPRIKEFYSSVVVPAFEELEVEFKKYKNSAYISAGSSFASIRVSSFDTGVNLTLNLEASIIDPTYLVSTYKYYNSRTGEEASHSVMLKNVDCDISEISKEDIIKKFVELYKKHTTS